MSARYNSRHNLLVTNSEKTVGATGGTVSHLAFLLQKDSVCFQRGKREAPDCFRAASLTQLADTIRTGGTEKMKLEIKTALIFIPSRQVVFNPRL